MPARRRYPRCGCPFEAPAGDDVASELRAVQDDRVVYGGLTYQGPIIHLFQLERAAHGLYPDEFGDEQLFDRDRVAGIVTGGIEE